MSDNKYFIWTTIETTDPINKAPNLLEPPVQKMQVGFSEGEKLPANWFNYILNYITSRSNKPAGVTKAEIAAISAADRGAGYMLYVTDGTPSPALAYSNGATWLYVYNNIAVN